MNDPVLLPTSPIESRIIDLRGQKVIIDADLAELYGVTTKRLNEQVRRSIERFPEDSCSGYRLKRKRRWSQTATTSRNSNSRRSCPMPSHSNGVMINAFSRKRPFDTR
jgi:hypothetical protein